MIKTKKQNGEKRICIRRSVCISPQLDKAIRKYLKENPEITFSKFINKVARERLEATDHFKRWTAEEKVI